MKNRAKKNNKGFSLVELIVVVLIIGVIAVALAPQVMKWVDTSKNNADLNNAETLQSSVQAALADWQNNGGKLDTIGDTYITYEVKSKDLKIKSGETDPPTSGSSPKELSKFIDEVTGDDYPEANTKLDSGNDFEVYVYETGKVVVSCKVNEITPATP